MENKKRDQRRTSRDHADRRDEQREDQSLVAERDLAEDQRGDQELIEDRVTNACGINKGWDISRN